MAYEFFTDSEVVTSGMLELEGVWLHDPVNPQATAKQFRYGRDARSTEIDIKGTELVFAGRRFPVMEYGEHEMNTYDVDSTVAHGPSYQSDLEEYRGFARLKRALFFRDNRGRAMYGTMSGYNETDESVGTGVSYTITRVNREETVS